MDEDGLAQDTVKAINLVERKDLAVIFQLHIFNMSRLQTENVLNR